MVHEVVSDQPAIPAASEFTMTEDCELNDGHIHEAIDRIDVSINYLQAALAEHALINAVAAYEAEVQAAIDILAKLYQRIGAHDHVSEISAEHGLKAGYVIAST